MKRTAALLCGLVLVVGMILSGGAASAASSDGQSTTPVLQRPDPTPNVNPAPVKPDVAYPTSEGGRVEVFSSVGDNDGEVDWRQVNQFAYLISSVPVCKQIRSTVYNSYWDHKVASAKSGKWELYDPSAPDVPLTTGIFSPAVAFRDQLNNYPRSCPGKAQTTAKDMVQVLGNKSTFNDALKAGSSLADLLSKAGVVKLCSHGLGACLSTTTAEELMHAKYALLEQAKDSTGKTWDNVVWITSANLNGASGGRKSNLSVALYGDANAYTQLRDAVWNAEVTQTFTPAYRAAMKTGIRGTNTDFTFYPSPRSSSAKEAPTDFESDFLASQTNSKLRGTKTSCKAYAVHSLFSEARKRILDGLAALQTDKCSVKIVLGKNALADLVNTYFSMSTSARQLIDRVEFGNVHDKTMTVSYTLNGAQKAVTFGGSENFNGTSLRYDELAFRADNLALTRAVEQQSERLYLLSKGGGAVTPVTAVSITPNPAQVEVGKTLALRARVTPSNASVTKVSWKSSAPSVATVDSAGMVKAVTAGSATVTATSLSGVRTGSTAVTVVAAGEPGTPPDTTPDPALTVTTPPMVSMPVYQSPKVFTQVVVTWAQGATDLSGKVSLQYYSGGAWKNYSTITVKNGRGVGSYVFKGSHTWRVRALSVSSPAKTAIGSAATYSKDYAPIVIRTADATTTPRLYAPNLVAPGGTVPFLLQWKNPYGGYPSVVRLQYAAGSKWITSKEFTFPAGAKQYLVGHQVMKSHKWRIATSSKSMPKSKATRASTSVTVTAR